MDDLVKSLAQTPLPTIMVVAGIVFLFLSIGGHLGAQIATDTIKRQQAAVIGAVLLIGGITLYFAGQLNQSDQISVSQDVSAKNGYPLRASVLAVGRVEAETTQMKLLDAALTLQSGDERVVGKFSMEGEESKKLEVLAAVEGRPLILKETTLSSLNNIRVVIDGNETLETEKGVLSGNSVLIQKKEGKWVKSLLDAQPSEAQRKELESPYADEYESYPAGTVALGTSWTLDGPQFAYIAGLGNLLSISGSATMTFEDVVSCGDDRCALISIKRMEMDGTMLDPENNVMRLKMGGSGTLYRSLTRFIDTKYSFDGTMSAEGDVVIEGQSVKTNFSGPLRVEGTRQLIGQ